LREKLPNKDYSELGVIITLLVA